MSKITVATLSATIAALELRVAQLEAARAPLRAAPRAAPRVTSFSQRSIAYCKQHGVSMVPASVVLEWRHDPR